MSILRLETSIGYIAKRPLLLTSSFLGLIWKAARIGKFAPRLHDLLGTAYLRAKKYMLTVSLINVTGERLSPYVALACVIMAGSILIS